MDFEGKTKEGIDAEPLSEELKASLLKDIKIFQQEEIDGKRKSVHLTEVDAGDLTEEDLRQYKDFLDCLNDPEHKDSAELMERFRKYRAHMPAENKNSHDFAAFIGNRWVEVQLDEFKKNKK